MPLPQLPEPKSVITRLEGLFRGLITLIIFIPSLILLNGVQMLSLLIKPISSQAFRNINRTIADVWWRGLYLWVENVHDAKVQLLGDDVPMRENALVVSNHQEMTDIPVIFHLGDAKGRLGDLKWYVKDIVKYVPGVGWGMLFLDCLFVKRDWTADKKKINDVFSNVLKNDIPLWIISFVEGTRSRPENLAESKKYTQKKGLRTTQHVLYPRTKGFTATAVALREHLDAVYDLTIAYTDGTPSLWKWLKGYPNDISLHVRRFSMEDMPKEQKQLDEWLIERFYVKDDRLDRYYKTGILDDDEPTPKTSSSES